MGTEAKALDLESSADPEHARSALHVSSGRLHGVHAQTVQSWRQLLRQGGDHRPRASTSDCLAAAVEDLLRSRPDPLEVARAAEAGRLASLGDRGLGGAAVSAYVGPDDVDVFLDLIQSARQGVQDLATQLRTQMPEAPDDLGQVLIEEHVKEALRRKGLPLAGRVIPRGAVVRLAVAHWAERSPTNVVATAATWAQEHHHQLHRARKDMRNLH